jgi:GR25 family glycosyltransferase involved in LPS biosynthesis
MKSTVSMSKIIESTIESTKDPSPAWVNLADYLKPTNLGNPISGVDHLYYINMDSSTERKNHIERVLNDSMFGAVPKTRISAVDGRDPNFQVEDHFVFYGGAQKHPRMMNVEYATTLSHIKALRQFVEDVDDGGDLDVEDPVALILEDDTSTEFVPYWKKNMAETVASAPADWEVLQLSYCLFDFTPAAPFESWEMRKNMCGAIAYLIRYSGARRILDYLCQYSNPAVVPFQYYIDGQYPYFHQADRLIYTFLKTYSVNPPPFTYRDSNDSTIHPDHVDFHAKSKERTKKLWAGLDATEGASL